MALVGIATLQSVFEFSCSAEYCFFCQQFAHFSAQMQNSIQYLMHWSLLLMVFNVESVTKKGLTMSWLMLCQGPRIIKHFWLCVCVSVSHR